jgi:hypothetical protein
MSHDEDVDERGYYAQSPSMLNPAMEFHTYDRRRSSVMSSTSEGRRPSYPLIPFSPPHQSYDHRTPLECEKPYYRMMIPSPPPSLFKANDYNRRLSMEDRLPLRRQSADAYYKRPVDRRSSQPEEVVHLPPLRLKPQEGVVEVDAAVAMMELASRKNAFL